MIERTRQNTGMCARMPKRIQPGGTSFCENDHETRPAVSFSAGTRLNVTFRGGIDAELTGLS
jgi:hypothetical protein